MKVIVYISCLSQEYTHSEFDTIVKGFAANNKQNDVTGVLYCNMKNIMQVFEGNDEQVDKLWSNIQRDSRHHNIKKMIDEQITTRMFSEWSMNYVYDDACNNTDSIYYTITVMKRVCLLLDTFKKHSLNNPPLFEWLEFDNIDPE